MKKVRNFCISLCLLINLLLISSILHAQTVVKGNIISDTVWTLGGSPYIINSGDITIGEKATLTIQPGVIIKLYGYNYYDWGTKWDGYDIIVKGCLKAQGTKDNPIIFTSLLDDIHGGDTNNDKAETTPSAGNWGILKFADTSHDCALENCKILYGGTVRNASQAIIWLDTASPTIRNCIIENNSSYVIDMDLPSKPVVENNSIAKNGYNGIHVRSGNYTQNGTWDCTNMPYILLNDITLEESCTLTIQPGVIIKLYGYDYYDWGTKWDGYDIIVKGSLKAKGTKDNPIVFTSLLDDIHGGDTNNDKAKTVPGAGNWGYIWIDDTSRNSDIEHCKILYGGMVRNANNGVVFLNGTSPTIANCEFTYNHQAISCNNSSAPRILGNTIRKCTSDAIICNSKSAPTINQNSIYDNNGLGIKNNDKTVIIDARNNWWGDASGPLDNSDDRSTGGWYNPNGQGEKVSNYVNYTSWLNAPPPLPWPVPPICEEHIIARHTFTLTLGQGLNMISLPLKPDTAYNAKTFCEKLGATMVIRLNPTLQEFDAFVPATSIGNNFPIEGGRGYIVNIENAKQVSFEGEGWRDSGAPPKSSDNSKGLWAFVVGGLIFYEKGQDIFDNDNLSIQVKNLDLNVALRCIAYKTDKLSYLATYFDASRQNKFLAGHVLEISLLAPDGKAIGKPIYYKLIPQDINKAYVNLTINISSIIQDRIILCQNYPNPFNADTWIPYCLGKSSRVSIEIYDINGKLIRSLDLGYKERGFYFDKARAVYWDGKNESGEGVSSGVYFYKLKADKHTAVRKLVVLE